MIFSWLYLFIFLQFIYTSAALIPLVATLAGTIDYGYTNGEGTNARFDLPSQGDISPDGTIFLVADYTNHLLRQIIIATSTVSTLAGQAGVPGSTNGEGTNAKFNYLASISYSPDGSYALIADFWNHLIRKIILSTAMVTKIAGGGSSGTSSGSTNGEGTNALFYIPNGIRISPDGVTAIIADPNNHMIRKIIITTSVVTTFAGQTTSGSNNGIGTLAKFYQPTGVDYFPDGSAILVADYNNNLIRKIIIATAEVSTLAGTATTTGSTNGFGTNARFNKLQDIRISPDASYALVADRVNNMIRSIILSTLFVNTIIGTTTSGSTNGVGTNALSNGPSGVAIAPNGEYFLISDSDNHMIRYVAYVNEPTIMPSLSPSCAPSRIPSASPTSIPSFSPTHIPSLAPTFIPSVSPTSAPSFAPTVIPSTIPTGYPSSQPTFIPSVSPTSAPSVSPTLIPPTGIPSSLPSSSPSISFQPTAACPPGHIRNIHNEEDPTSCKSCKEGYYSDGGNENSCHACSPLTWNIGHGNADCEYTTIRHSASDGYPIAFCVFYALLSMICFGLILRLGGSWTVFLNILIITTDQITDILYSWYSLFADSSLLYLSITFCVVNLLVPMIYLLWNISLEHLLATQWLRLSSDRYHKYDLSHGHYEENEHPRYAGWVFHSIHGWSIGEFFPFSLIYYVIDFFWIVLRLLLMILIVIGSIICQLLLLLVGVMLYASKLMSISVVEIWFWGQWNPTYLDTHPHLIRDESPAVYNTLVLVEVCSECIPQFIIQITNSILMSAKWTPLAILSVIMSGFMIISVFYHFVFKHQQLLHSGDPTYTSFDFSRIPKYDLYGKFFTSISNQRKKIVPTPPTAATVIPAKVGVVVEVAVAVGVVDNNPQDISTINHDERNV